MLTALAPLAALAALASPPSADSVATHTETAHRSLPARVREQVVPSLRSYESLARDLGERLEALEDIQDTIQILREMRRSAVTFSLENTIPGFGFLTSAFDKLNDLNERLAAVKRRLETLKSVSSELLTAAARYMDSPGDPNFLSLMRGYEGATDTFDGASTAFEELDGFIAGLMNLLGRTSGVITSLERIPLLGEYATPLRDDLTALSAKLQLTRGVLAISTGAITRDRASLDGLRATLDEAHAHDAYDAATGHANQSRPGSALAAYREVRHRWPDTQWAHRSDRRIVTLTTQMDALHAELHEARVALEQSRTDLATAQSREAARQDRERSALARTTAAAARASEGGHTLYYVAGIVALLLLGAMGWRRLRG